MDGENTQGNLWVAISIVIAGLLIAGAVYLTSGGTNSNNPDSPDVPAEGDLSQVRAPRADEHIKGDINAPVKIIEYSDTECPFCAVLHATMNEVVSDYDGQVVWIYRHLPLTQLHSKAVVEAHATECAAALGGNEAFWKYTDRLYEITPSNNKLDLVELPNIAEFAGLNKDAFNACMDSEAHISKIEADYNEAVKAAGQRLGTPFNIVIAPDGTRTAVSGALPKENWVTMIDGLLAQ